MNIAEDGGNLNPRGDTIIALGTSFIRYPRRYLSVKID